VAVIANAVKQSMQSEVMDRHASLAMTVHGPGAASGRYGGLAMTTFLREQHARTLLRQSPAYFD
jgi:hypothetical protein